MIIRLALPANGPSWLPLFAKSIVEWLNRIAGRTGTTAGITADATLDALSGTVFADATAGNIVVSLPAAASVPGRIYTVKKVDASANTVTIDPAAAETIDGAATKVISAQWVSLTIQADGAEWFLI